VNITPNAVHSRDIFSVRLVSSARPSAKRLRTTSAYLAAVRCRSFYDCCSAIWVEFTGKCSVFRKFDRVRVSDLRNIEPESSLPCSIRKPLDKRLLQRVII